MSICVLAERYGVKGQTPRKQYKEKISDYRNWDQLEHAHDYLSLIHILNEASIMFHHQFNNDFETRLGINATKYNFPKSRCV